ncbi:MAG: hypothetical protein A2284_08315 [Deltaproteobacteria bacterium RIFOXYA12_FULL_61_11]|nr:MAG: hypothetical protein A2284_08315 [Deltaproteobacteria bacterium RIFOXYA12_FULL_61_11]
MLQELQHYLRHRPIVPFAVTSDKLPTVRPMTITSLGDRLYTHTDRSSRKMTALRENPAFSFYVTDDQGFLRFVHGRTVFRDEPSLRAALFEAEPILHQHYKSSSDQEFEVLELEVERIDWYEDDGSLNGWKNPEVQG